MISIYLCQVSICSKKVVWKWQKLIDNWGFDLHLLLNVHSNNYTVKQIMIPEIEDRRKETKELIPMANEIASLLFSKKEKTEKKLKILLITAHPDDCEIFCGGTIAQTCLSGGEVKSIIITGNEETETRINYSFPNITKLLFSIFRI